MTVLAEEIVRDLSAVGVATLMLGVVSVIVGVGLSLSGYKVIGTICFAFSGLLIGITFTSVGQDSYQQLKVLLSDSYPAAELYDRYDVVEKEGEIWVIKEKPSKTKSEGEE